jgi:acetyl-CoA carboxylase biotin carboxyl carrier protein
MKIQDIKDIIEFIAKSGLEEVNIETDSFKLNIKRGHNDQYLNIPPQIGHKILNSQILLKDQFQEKHSNDITEVSSQIYHEIKSPMIGTFYSSAKPSAPPFVSVGDIIQKGQKICVIEAMKLFNEIESDISGVVVSILIDNASPVEYDQPLFLINPK